MSPLTVSRSLFLGPPPENPRVKDPSVRNPGHSELVGASKCRRGREHPPPSDEWGSVGRTHKKPILTYSETYTDVPAHGLQDVLSHWEYLNRCPRRMGGPPFSLVQRFEFFGSLFDLDLDQFWADLNFHWKRNIRASGQFVVSDRFGFPHPSQLQLRPPVPRGWLKKPPNQFPVVAQT